MGAQSAALTGQITFGSLPLPGATVTAVGAGKEVVVTSDIDGGYRFSDLTDGAWTIRVEMLGFTPVSRELLLPSSDPVMIEVTLLPFDEIARTAVRAPASPGSPRPGGEFQRAQVNATRTAPAREAAPQMPLPPDPFGDSAMSAADGLLINGSVNNGGASPFSQSAAFGNNRRGTQSLYNWGLGTQLGHSALDARPYSFGGRPTVKPDYSDIQIMGTFGGPLRVPGLRNAPLLYLGYQRLEDHNATTQSAIMPTVAQRGATSRTRHSGSSIPRPACPSPATRFPTAASATRRDRCSGITRCRMCPRGAASTSRRRW